MAPVLNFDLFILEPMRANWKKKLVRLESEIEDRQKEKSKLWA